MAAESFAERLWEGIDEVIAPYDVPSELGEMLKADLKKAFDVKGTPRPGYEPGAFGVVKFNLIDAVTDPVKTFKETIFSIFENRSLPSIPLAWTDAEKDVWTKLFFDPTIGWVDPTTGDHVVPLSLREAIRRWNDKARLRVTRLIAEEKGIQQSPGLTLMMANRLNDYYGPGTFLPAIIADAGDAELAVSRRLRDAELALKAGDREGADKLWKKADDAQKKWVKSSKNYRDGVRKEFERISRMGSQKKAPPAAHTLANSQEAKFWRYWDNRNLYFTTLNFLNTYKEKGFWGTAKIYAWDWGVGKIFGLKPKAGASALARLRYYSYPAHALTWVVGKVAEKVGLTKILTGLTSLKTRFARFWSRFIKKPLEGLVVKIGAKLGLKVLMAKIGALIGSVIPGAGTAAGAVIAAVASFIVGIVSEKAMKAVLKPALYLFAGAFGCLVLAVGGAAMFIIFVVGSIFAPGAEGGPGPVPLPPIARVTVKKESCVKKIVAEAETWFCQNPRTIGNNTGVREIKWQITIENGSGQTAEVIVSDEECGQTWEYKGDNALGAGEKRTPNCIKNYDTNNPALHNTTVYNTVTGTAWVGSSTRNLSAVGTLYIGTPSSCLLDVPFFCQNDYSAYKCCWQSGPLASCPSGSQDTIAHSGCGCTSETMLVNYYGAATTPPDLCGTYGCTANQGGSNEHLGAPLSTRYAPCDSADNYFAVIEAHLCPPNNRPLIALRHNPSWTWGHFAVITGVDPGKREVTLNDPAYFGCTKGYVMGFDEFYAEAARRGCLLYYGPPK